MTGNFLAGMTRQYTNCDSLLKDRLFAIMSTAVETEQHTGKNFYSPELPGIGPQMCY